MIELRVELSGASFDHCCDAGIKRWSDSNVKQRTRPFRTFL